MAVVQISKIQVRRGKKNTTGMPQLASGELAWAIDTQELYIGNGAVGEGAPAVGNTKVLTENDNIIDLLNQYSYKPTDTTLSTGLPGPTERSLQERLDEGAVNASSFGISGDSVNIDQTALIQNAIWSLYDPGSSPTTNRVSLEFDPGTYLITGTLYIPSNVSLVGSGIDKTVFYFVKGGFNTGATLALAGTSITSAGNYNSVATTAVTGTGTGAVINVAKTGAGTSYTTGNTTITIVTSGSGYVTGDQIKILGNALGGTTPANDLTITLTNTKTGANDYPTFTTAKLFEFINNTSTRSSRNASSNSTSNQCRNVIISGISVNTSVSDYIKVFEMTSLIDSQFVNIDCVSKNRTSNTIVSPTSVTPNSVVLNMIADSAVLTCQRNTFTNVRARGFSYGVYSSTDIINNHFSDCVFEDLYNAVVFATGSTNGARKNIISDSIFNRIRREGFIVAKGYGNRSKGNTYINVGSNLSGSSNASYSIIQFDTPGNNSIQDSFDRNVPLVLGGTETTDLARNNYSVPYAPEIGGITNFSNAMPTQVSLSYKTTPDEAFRLPINNATSIEVNYVFRSNTFLQMRKGTLHIAIDRDRSNLQLVDEYEYVGASGDDSKLAFTASIATVSGVKSLVISYTYLNVGDSNSFTYTYNMLS
jgi:hypothetical protein